MYSRGFRKRLQVLERSLRRSYPTIDPAGIVQTVLEQSSDEALQLLSRVKTKGASVWRN